MILLRRKEKNIPGIVEYTTTEMLQDGKWTTFEEFSSTNHRITLIGFDKETQTRYFVLKGEER